VSGLKIEPGEPEKKEKVPATSSETFDQLSPNLAVIANRGTGKERWLCSLYQDLILMKFDHGRFNVFLRARTKSKEKGVEPDESLLLYVTCSDVATSGFTNRDN
jgi:hypothetical protein